MEEIIFSTLSVGNLYEKYTIFYIKKLELISDFEINFCITSDHHFGDKIKAGKVKCHFNILGEDLVNSTHKSDNHYNKTTCFKYFYKSYALEYAAKMFPNKSICHTDCDIVPNKQFSVNRFLSFDKTNTLYCPNTVSCSGGYGGPSKQDGRTINIVPKLKYIMDEFIPDFDDYENIRFPIENVLFFNKIPHEVLLKFCDDWRKIGSFSDKKGYPTYGDCFEIKPSCIINKINVEQTSLFPFCDSFKGRFVEILREKEKSFDNYDDFLNFIINEKLM